MSIQHAVEAAQIRARADAAEAGDAHPCQNGIFLGMMMWTAQTVATTTAPGTRLNGGNKAPAPIGAASLVWQSGGEN